MATINNFVELPITNEINTISLWMAERRILYEYPHYGSNTFGKYDETHIPNIQKGIKGELITFDYFHTKLDEKFGGLPWENRWESVKDRLCLQNHIGRFDTGSDMTIRGKTIDVKTYHEKKPTKAEMMRLNLLVNVNEARGKEEADFYIQAFFTPNGTIVLAGCHRGLPEHIGYRFPEPAHACPVGDLEPIAVLEELLLETE
ncbi:MAG: hypothetical protein OXU51_07710 [Candidatus Poribacteria bacterium]|nr:hypothetical protein [Candidatus Poribacteria bacterium]